MTPGQTKGLIAAGAALTAALIAFAPRDGEVVVSEPAKASRTPAQPVAAPGANRAPTPEQGRTLLHSSERGPVTGSDASTLFSAGNWVVAPPPPPPAPPPPPPPPPSAPPLPFAFMGRFEQGDTQMVMLTRGNRVLTASQGDVLENTYRIDRIETSKVTITYLPLGTTQFLPTGSTQ